MQETEQKTPIAPDESQKVWGEYLQKCCEVGQLRHALAQLDGQTREIEKNLEVTERAVKSAAAKHRELQQKALAKPSDKGVETQGAQH